jgi:hypothetical protein
MRLPTAFLAAAVLACAAAPALAATTYTDFGAFSAAAGPLTANNLDGAPAGLDWGDFSFGVAGATGTVTTAIYGTGNSAQGEGDDATFIFTFDAPVFAFGFDLFDLGTVGAGDLVITVDGVDYGLFTNVTGANGNKRFGGVTDAAGMTNISIYATRTGDVVELDNVLYRGAAPDAVPEPATWAMMLMGFGGLGAVLRRRRALAFA